MLCPLFRFLMLVLRNSGDYRPRPTKVRTTPAFLVGGVELDNDVDRKISRFEGGLGHSKVENQKWQKRHLWGQFWRVWTVLSLARCRCLLIENCYLLFGLLPKVVCRHWRGLGGLRTRLW